MAALPRSTCEELERLRQERVVLARQIHEQKARHDDDEDAQRKLQELLASHVIISRTITRLCDPNVQRRDPLETLPSELWTQIIKMAVEDDHASVTLIAPMCRVSRTWLRLITNEPSFWTTIHTYVPIDGSLERIKAQVSMNLRRSSSLDLDLYVDFHTETWKQHFAPIISPHAGRVKKVVALPPVFSELLPVSYEEGLLSVPFPNLKILEWHGLLSCVYTTHIWPLLRGSPRLEELKGALFMEVHASNNLFPCLRSLELDVGLMQVMPTLERMELLRSVKLTSRSKPPPPIGPQTCSRGSPLRWIHLDYSLPDTHLCEMLIGRLGSSLRELAMALDVDNLSSICASLGVLTNLEAFTCQIRCARGVKPLSPSSSPSLPVRYCKVDIRYAVPDTDWDADVRDDPALEVFLASFLLHFPLLETLSVITWSQPCKIFLDAYPQLRSVDTGPDIVPFCRPQSHLPNLRVMKVACNVGNINNNAYPNVERLKLRFAMDAWRSTENSPFRRLYLVRWTCLAVLYLEMRCYMQEASIRFDLPALRILRISARGDISTFICCQLAMQCETTPSLQQVEFVDNYPEWDVLFITLERRILSQFEPVKIINTLSFPGYPPNFCLASLVDRLKGLLTPRPTSFELSVYAVMDKLGDMSVTGCQQCIKLHRPCSKPTTHLSYSPPTPSSSRENLYTYPKTDKEVIDTWMSRSWERAWLHGIDYRRMPSCQRLLGRSNVTLSEYTECL
ncbi:hypothetical protein PIIN_01166 [Serendipita indica DSM 11827]|uniref:F-box domain-containing protein n=1 Tax=Serendipita indica (strain DSM 11827) TaxID=1109443 RepID=G4T7M7_SERID|nr:hypothetical protein PIIN_01166 [Serendipita indica DSM 11827]